ncbi:unnamed protein product [Lasius platythorax]|uniref:Endonuclease-reverse transcriptase n=1 Tax=Lasius platythorax TaxID=488582 RepID=A0AAV2NMI9_9HYME
MEERMDGLEERLSKIEQKGSNREEEEEERTEELVGKIIEKVKKKERMIEGQAPSNIMETREEVKKIKKAMEDRERKERRNNLIITELKKEKKNIYETTREFLEEFGVIEGVKRIQAVGKEGREMIIVEMSSREEKEGIMKVKKKLGSRRVYIDHDLTMEEREVQRKLRERAREEKMEGRRVKVGYRKIEIQGKLYV